MTKLWRTIALAALGPALTVGCGLLPGGGGGGGERNAKPDPPVKIKTVSLAMLPDTNDNWPAAVELVRVRDESLVEVLLRTDTADWFAETGESFRMAHPDALFDDWEVVPGSTVGPVKVGRRGRFGGVLFCGLREPGPPVRVTHKGRVMITVDDSGCVVSRTSKNPKKPDAPNTDKWWIPW